MKLRQHQHSEQARPLMPSATAQPTHFHRRPSNRSSRQTEEQINGRPLAIRMFRSKDHKEQRTGSNTSRNESGFDTTLRSLHRRVSATKTAQDRPERPNRAREGSEFELKSSAEKAHTGKIQAFRIHWAQQQTRALRKVKLRAAPPRRRRQHRHTIFPSAPRHQPTHFHGPLQTIVKSKPKRAIKQPTPGN